MINSMADIEEYYLGRPMTEFVPFGINGGSRVELNAESLDILIGFPTPTNEEVDSLFEEIEISLFTYQYVPFLILHTKKFTVDMSINIRKMKSDCVNSWLNNNSRLVKIIFVDSNGMNLVGLRIIQLPLMDDIRGTLKVQADYDRADINLFINQAMSLYDTQTMLQSAAKTNHFGSQGEFDFLKSRKENGGIAVEAKDEKI